MEETNTVTNSEKVNNQSVDDKLSKDTASLYKWQNKLLPFLIGIPTILIIAFIILATRQINEFNSKLNETKTSEFIGTVIPAPSDSLYSKNFDYIKWVTLLHMEQESIDKRYKQAGFLLMSRVVTKYLGFLTGMIMAIVGAAFIIGKLSEDKSTLEVVLANRLK